MPPSSQQQLVSLCSYTSMLLLCRVLLPAFRKLPFAAVKEAEGKPHLFNPVTSDTNINV